MKYDFGTVTVTNGSAVVTGSGTQWSANLDDGELFTVIGSGIAYTIGSVDSDTQVTLTANYAGSSASGLSYTVVQGFTPTFSIPYVDVGDVQTATILKRALMLIDYLFGWLVVGTATTAQLIDKTSNVNTLQKSAGRQVWNSTTGKPVWATGSGTTDTWKDATGTLAHTPV